MTTTPAGIPESVTIGDDLTVRRIGFGAMHLTGPGMWGPPTDRDNAVKVLRRAVDLGVTFIDTADSYGPGDNERVIRDALHPYPDNLVICTKGGMLRTGPTDWVRPGPPYIMPLGRPAYLRQQVELSLRNLGVDRIDLYQLHSIDPVVPLADQLGELAVLRDEGKIRHIGISGQPEVPADILAESRRICPNLAAVENLYNIADRNGAEALRYAELQDMVFIPWFPLGHGDLLDPAGPLTTIARDYHATAAQLALAWLLHHSPATLLIPGTTSVTHLEENMRAADIALSSSDLAAIDAAIEASGLHTWRPSRRMPSSSTELPVEHPNIGTLRTLYADLESIAQYCDPDVVLHTAQRGLPGHTPFVRGVASVAEHEQNFVGAFDGTLTMDVRHLWANAYFGVALGTIRGRANGAPVAMPFCGLWRFNDRRIVEHWENAYDPTALG